MNDLVPKSIAEQHFIGKCEAEAKAAQYKKLAQESIPKELIKAIAMEIGKSTAAYVEVMYPEAVKAASSTFLLSLRNHIHNEIVSMAELHDEASMRDAIEESRGFRTRWVAQYRKMRRSSTSTTKGG